MQEGKELETITKLTREQIELIKHTVAVGASDNELKLFLYQASKRGLDPLARQIHFIKRKRFNPDTDKYEEVGTIQTGIDGFRVIANRTGKLSGIKRGVLRDGNKLLGAWAEVYRKDWTQPAREEVSFNEYCKKKKDGTPMGLWAEMPEAMIKKVAEASALRMAFPEDLSGIYSHDEMQQADTEVTPASQTQASPPEATKKTKRTEPEPQPDSVERDSRPPNGQTGDNLPEEAVETSPTLVTIDQTWLLQVIKDTKWQFRQWVNETFGLKVTGDAKLAAVLKLLDNAQLKQIAAEAEKRSK